MEIQLKRTVMTPKSTIGELYVNNKFECYVLEDTDRRLEQNPDAKIHGETCIPRGKYQIVVTQSARFGRPLPLLVDVPGYTGVRIHTGNKPADTDGCLLPGLTYKENWVSDSTVAWAALFDKIKSALTTEKVWITIS